MGRALDAVSAEDARGFFEHCGYPIPAQPLCQPLYTTEESRYPTLVWPRELPIDGEPEDVMEIVKGYSHWLAESEMPKLFVNAEPGVILTGAQREFCRTWKNQEEVTVRGAHFVQEDSPHEIGEAVASFITGMRR